MIRHVSLLFFFLSCQHVAQAGYVTVSGKNLVHNGQKIFLSGANSAWVNFGHDFGNHQYQYHSRSRYLELLNEVSKAGGNSMRTWVHIEGQSSPAFNSQGYVTGLDHDGSFISDFKRYLDDAQAKNILIFPTLWSGALKQNPTHLQGLITDTRKLQSYIDKALVPWVNAVKNHPALGGWDIINEMEGFIIPGQHDSEPCFDTTFLSGSGAGWAGKSYTAQQLLRFINWQVDAIRKADPSALVTAGSWSQKSASGQFGDKNLYSDTCLVKAGGKARGTLTFYSTHTYDWQRKFASDATFVHSAADYHLDKPLVVSEFNSVHGGGHDITYLFNHLYTHGYAGAWSWHMKADGADTDSTATQVRGIAALRGKHGAGGNVAINLNRRG